MQKKNGPHDDEIKDSYIVFSINFYSRYLNSYERLFSESDPWGTRDEFLQKDDGVSMDTTGVHRENVLKIGQKWQLYVK